MKRFIVIQDRSKIAININAITNFKAYSTNETYIDFYANDSEHNTPFMIDRAEAKYSFDEVCQMICESSYKK